MSATFEHLTPVRRAQWVVTTETAPWVIAGIDSAERLSSMPNVMVHTDRPRQTIEGFGASFNELGWTALAFLDDAQRSEILRELFAPGVGSNLALCRMPLGANDFSLDWYSYDEVEGDFELEHFSIAKDLDALVPFIRAAREHQPDLRLWASPWSPPTWMKTNGHYACAAPFPGFQDVVNGIRPDQIRHEGTDVFIQDERHLASYARYFGRFIDAYRAEGISIEMVMPQNEFNSAQIFPSCTWTPAGLAAFIAHLGPEMRSRDVDVFLGTLERADEGLVDAILADPVAAEYVAGVGVQWHGKFATPFIHRDRPSLPIYQTEQECGDGRNDWRFCRYAWKLMKRFFDDGAGAYMYWNMALLEGGVSRWGWAQNSLVTVDPATHEFRFNHEHYLLKHVSHFVRPGAQVLPTLSFTGHENQLAFRNPDGEIVLVAHNDLGVEQTVAILIDGAAFEPTLAADSFNTFVIPPRRS